MATCEHEWLPMMTATYGQQVKVSAIVGSERCRLCGVYQIEEIRKQLAAERARRESGEEALREIGWSTHCEYGQAKAKTDGDIQYSTGVVDGHRCAAQVARKHFARYPEAKTEKETR